mgnify:CR=1 FL=1
MRLRRTLLTLALAAAVFGAAASAQTPADRVDPFIGTDVTDLAPSDGLAATWWWPKPQIGNTHPGATSPFGMIQLSPDTSEAPNWGDASGYDYNRNTIFGFSHTRLSGTGASDLIDITLMPTSSGRTSSAFSHEEEKASPSAALPFLASEGRVLQARHDRAADSGYRAVAL